MAVSIDDLAHGKIICEIAIVAGLPRKLFFTNEKAIYAWTGTTWENILTKE